MDIVGYYPRISDLSHMNSIHSAKDMKILLIPLMSLSYLDTANTDQVNLITFRTRLLFIVTGFILKGNNHLLTESPATFALTTWA